MGLIYDYSKIREEYNDIEEDKRILPSPSDVDFEEAYMTLELMIREILGIDKDEGSEDGKSWEDAIEEVENLITQAKVYDQAGYVIGKPEANQRVFLLVAVRDFIIPENFLGSQARCITASTGQAIFTIKKNGATIGYITFQSGTNIGVFSSSLSGDISFTAGDYLEIIAPSEQDTTLSDICWNLKIMFT